MFIDEISYQPFILVIISIGFIGCGIIIYSSFKVNKNIHGLRREIYLTDKEIIIPIDQKYPGNIRYSVGSVIATSGNIKYDNIKGYNLYKNQGCLEIVTNIYNMKFFLDKKDIKKVISIIQKYRNPTS